MTLTFSDAEPIPNETPATTTSDASRNKNHNILPASSHATHTHRRSRSCGTAAKEKDYERLAQVFGWRQETREDHHQEPENEGEPTTTDASDVPSRSYADSSAPCLPRTEEDEVQETAVIEAPVLHSDLPLDEDNLVSPQVGDLRLQNENSTYLDDDSSDASVCSTLSCTISITSSSNPTPRTSFPYKPRDAHQAKPISGSITLSCDSMQPSHRWSPSAITTTLADIEETPTVVPLDSEKNAAANDQPKTHKTAKLAQLCSSKSAPSSPPHSRRLQDDQRNFEHDYPRDPRIFDFLRSNDDPCHILWLSAKNDSRPPNAANSSGIKEVEEADTEKRERILMAATLEKLVEILTREIDYTFMTDFFLVYRTFCTPLQLCNLLILRFRWALSQNLEERRVVRIRTFVVLRHWLFHYYTHDFLPSRPLRRMLFLYLDSLPEHPIVRSSPLDARIVRNLRQVVRRLTKTYPVVRVPTVEKQDERQSTVADSDATQACAGHESIETCKDCARRSYLDIKSDSSDEHESSSEKGTNRRTAKSDHPKAYLDTSSTCVSPELKCDHISVFSTTPASKSDLYDHRAPPVPGATDGCSAWSRTWTITMGKLARVKRMVIGRGSRSVVSDSPHSMGMDPKNSPKTLSDPRGIIDFNNLTPSYPRDCESRELSPRSSVSTGSSSSTSRLEETPPRHRYLFDIDDSSANMRSNANVGEAGKRSPGRNLSGSTRRSNSLNSSMSGSSNPPKISHSLRVPYRCFVTAYRSEAIAQQMCLIERDVLIAVSWKELLERSWCKSGTAASGRKSGVAMVIERFNLTCQWVVSEIASVSTIDDRARLIEKLVRIALKCYQHANFASLTQILLGLQSPNVARLRETWSRVGAYETRVLKDLQDFSSPARNWKRIREAMLRVVDEWGEGGDLPGPAEEAVIADEGDGGIWNSSEDYTKERSKVGGCVPFLGLYLSDLTFIAELPSFIDPPESPSLDVASDATDEQHEQQVTPRDCRSSLLSSSSTLYSLSRNPSFNDGGSVDGRGSGMQNWNEAGRETNERDESHTSANDRHPATHLRPKSEEKAANPRTEPGPCLGRPRLTSPPQRPVGGRLVNFHKHRIVAVVLKRALAFQTLAKRYPFRTDPNLRAQCTRLRCLDNGTVRELACSFGE